MPRVSRFYGIVIYIYGDDHNPPHFHARYSGRDAAVEIATLALVAGGLPIRAMRLVNEWGSLHQPELLQGWECAQRGETPPAIPPLP